jgi:uncharacterized RDD family membrane protein YckC
MISLFFHNTDEKQSAKAGAKTSSDSKKILIHPASRYGRFIAAMLDGMIMLLIMLPFVKKMNLLENPEALSTRVALFLMGFVTMVIINGYLLSSYGQTVGKWLVGIKIVSIDERPLTLSRIMFIRYLPFQMISQLPVVGLAAALLNVMFIFKPDRRCLHDHIAGTVVVSKKVNI